ncbi:hypothetical protein BCR35DRAFT_330588 [Leucosporidium creatinivorum]|uniref:MYND-type domain-containing protein n=1 Tax=Leucosporidium creatinivorum TaxID=106004 RepID=A0A1Y2FRU5_9BASI|nr:hypothetical protein BCR35DRAFT_330588 [Leucosporidium creatinivorum]
MTIEVTQKLLKSPHPLIRPEGAVVVNSPFAPLQFIPVKLCCYAYLEPSTQSEGIIASITTESTLLIAHCAATGRISVSNAVAKGTDWSRYAQQLSWLTKDKNEEVELLLLAVTLELRHAETIDLELESTLRSVAETVGVRLTTKSIDLPPRAFSVRINKKNASTSIHTYSRGEMWNSLARFNEFNTYPVWFFVSYLAFFQWTINANFGGNIPLWMIYDGSNKDLLKLATTSNSTRPRPTTEDKAAKMRHGVAMERSEFVKERLPHMIGSVAAWGSWCAVCIRQDGPLQRCGGCGWETYCGKEHQNADWEYHKSWCKKNRKSTSS